MDAPNERLVIQPSFPLAWKHASIDCPVVSYEYAWDGRVDSLLIKTPRPLSPTIRLRARFASIKHVAVNGESAGYTVDPGIGYAWIVITPPRSETTRVEIVYGAAALPAIELPAVNGLPGETVFLAAKGGKISAVHDVQGMSEVAIAADGQQCSATLPNQSGVYTVFVLVNGGDARLWVPVELEVKSELEEAPVTDAELTAVPVDLETFHNQRLADLHRNSYHPRIEEFYWVEKAGWMGETGGSRTVKPNGRSWWEGHGKDPTQALDTVLLASANGRFVSDNGIPFLIPASGEDAVFTSLYQNFPDRVEIPVKMRGKKICFLIAGSITMAQSRMENARITVQLGDGADHVLSLRNPETIDDWLGSGGGTPYVQSGRVQPLGGYTHAVLHEMDLGETQEIESVTLETITNETMVGLLGITVMQEE